MTVIIVLVEEEGSIAVNGLFMINCNCFPRTQQPASMRESILAAKSGLLSCKISPRSLVAPGHLMNVLSKRNSCTSTVLPLLSTLALRHCSTGHHRLHHCCAGPMLSPASQLTMMVSVIAPAGTVVSVSALLDPEISTFLDIISPPTSPESTTNIPESSWCQSGQLQMMGGHSPSDTWS